MRVTALAIVAAAVIAGGAGAAGSETSARTYLRLAAGASFSYALDYGSHPDSVYNGKFSWTFGYAVNAIAVYDGRRVWVPQGAMLSMGYVQVDEGRTQWG